MKPKTKPPTPTIGFIPFDSESALDDILSPLERSNAQSKDRAILLGFFNILLYNKTTFGLNDLLSLKQHLSTEFVAKEWKSLVADAVRMNKLKQIPSCYNGDLYQSLVCS